MGRRKAGEVVGRRTRLATSPEEREMELTSYAYDLAEEQIRAGTASSQVITHFLKAGSARERLEQQRIQHENEFLEVKREAIQNQARVEELYMQALDAMRSYAGHLVAEEEDEAAA